MSNTRFYRPSPGYDKFVSSYLIIEDTNTDFGNSLSSISVYPNGHNAIGFNYGDPTSHTNLKGDVEYLYHSSFLVGTQENTYQIFPTKQQQEFVIIFKPYVLTHLLRTSMQSVKNGIFQLDSVIKEEAEICEKLKASPTHLEKIKVIENWLYHKLNKINIYPDITSHIIEEIKQNSGDVRIEELCKKHHVNRKYLERKFSDIVGISPKRFADIIKLNNILCEMTTLYEKKWSDFYANNGFTDYSHLSKYIFKMTGYQPRILKEKFLPLQQYMITASADDMRKNLFMLRDGEK